MEFFSSVYVTAVTSLAFAKTRCLMSTSLETPSTVKLNLNKSSSAVLAANVVALTDEAVAKASIEVFVADSFKPILIRSAKSPLDWASPTVNTMPTPVTLGALAFKGSITVPFNALPSEVAA